MLGRKLSGSASFVCLRCRLQLATGAGTPRRPPFSAVALQSTLRTATRRYNGTYTGNPHSHEPRAKIDDELDTDLSPEPKLERDAERNSDTPNYDGETISYWPPPAPPSSEKRRYKTRGRLVEPENEGLSIGILGKPGSAIVLREKRLLKKKRQAMQMKEDDGTLVDPTALLAGESAIPASEDILLNIHELKPKDTRILSNKQFNAVKDTLVDGFTNTQLGQYIREYHSARQLSKEDEPVSEPAPWVLEREPWAPILENAAPDIEPHLAGYIVKGMVPKQRLAVRLMRECWDVSNQKVLNRDGFVSIRLRDVEFSLLTLGNRRWLEGTARAILSRVKEVKLIRESRTVSIVAPQPAAGAILDRVDAVLSKARTSEYDLGLVSPEPLDPGVLEEVGRVTNTVIRPDPSGKKISVTWIHMTERNEDFENAGETVMRFLRDAYGSKTGVSSALAIVPSDLAVQGRYLPVLDSVQKLPWQERFNKWERWTAAISQSNSGSKARQPLIPAGIFPYDISTSEVATEPESSVDNPLDWSPAIHTETSAVFGQAVFARQKQDASSTTPPAEPPSQLDTSLPRTFIPRLPALGSLNLPSNLHEEGLWHTTVVVRFTPSPDLSPDLLSAAPDLELRINADHQEIISLTSLRAIKDTFTGDVLFPAAAVDTRITQQRYYNLPGTSIEHRAPSILAFLSKSDLRPWAGKLNTPPTLPGVRLPRRLLSQPTHEDTTTPTTSSPAAGEDINTTTNDDPATAEINYAFASIEVQRTVAAEYQGLKLRYTSIQGGQRGGERSELSLDAVRVDLPPLPPSNSHASLTSNSDAYEIIDDVDEGESDGRSSQFIHHSQNQNNTSISDLQSLPSEPVDLEEFIEVASNIVNEKGRLRWHAKRS